MKKALFAAAVCVLSMSCFAAGRASITVTQDGSWWAAVDSSARTDVVEGMLDAYQSAWEDGAVSEEDRIMGEVNAKKSPTFAKASYAIVYRKVGETFAANQRYPGFSRTFGFYSAAISDFYNSRSPGAANIGVGLVLSCLVDKPRYTCDEIEKMFAK